MVLPRHDAGMHSDLRGLWVPLVTPFDADGEVDLVSTASLCRGILADGATGIVALGTTGEPATLDPAERRAVVETCAEVCAEMGRPLIVGAGTNSTRSTLAAVAPLADMAAVVAALVVVPYYTRPTVESIVEHFRVVAEASPVPVVVYNVPHRTGRGLDADAILEIASFANVAGLKQAVGAIDGDTLEVLRCKPASFQVLAGDDAFVAPLLLMGGSGAIAAAAHVCTWLFADLVAAALAGDVPRARSVAMALQPVVDGGFAEPNPAVFKAVLHARGAIASPALRPPMGAASARATAGLLEAIRRAEHCPTR
jgi:4-hydroxy-tetrahydrodipicolinate synthase